jgi:hypothetical protein
MPAMKPIAALRAPGEAESYAHAVVSGEHPVAT